MLTGSETVAATAAASGHRHRPDAAVVEVLPGGTLRATTWGLLMVRVRHVALGLAGGELPVGTTLPLSQEASVADRTVTFLAAAAAGLVVATEGPPARSAAGNGTGGAPRSPDLDELATAGARLDEREPDRFERLVAGRAPDEVLLRCGDVTHSHRSLLGAARSLVQAADLTPGRPLLVDLPPSVAQVVAAVVVPSLSGASSWVPAPGTSTAAAALLAEPALAVVGAEGAAALASGRDHARRSRRRRGRSAPACTVLQAVAGSPAPPIAPGAAGALDVAAAGGVVTGFGPPGSLGRPLPGVSIAIDDDGQVLVRAAGMAPGTPGRRPDGWLATGLRGWLEGGALQLDHQAAEPVAER